MFEKITPEHSAALDEIIGARRSVRAFDSTSPGRKVVETIIKAGLAAPFSASAQAGKTDFRKIVVMSKESPAMNAAAGLIAKWAAEYARELEKESGPSPFTRLLKEYGQQGLLFTTAPYYVVLAEEKSGASSFVDMYIRHSLGYCLHNMWLKATTLRVGLQVITSTMALDNDPDFCELLGIAPGKYVLDGCALGYPSDTYQPPAVRYPDMATSLRWL
jgi:nitroreductase